MRLRVNLFRRFQAFNDQLPLDCFDPIRVQELFSYLLLHRQRPHRREALIEILWGENSPKQAKKYLRQLIWQLRTGLQEQSCGDEIEILAADEEWISLNDRSDLLLDVEEFERAYALTRDVDGAALSSPQAEALQQAVKLYAGDLLEGWYQDWCLFERERLQNIYLLMLDKLMAYCETQSLFETGIQYGVLALRCDRAREITYRRLMRLCYLAGDRTGALRYYSRCEEALRTELEVEPTAQTHALWREICADRFSPAPRIEVEDRLQPQPDNLAALLDSCRTLNQVLAEAREYNQQHIRLLTSHLSDQDANAGG